MTWLNIRKFIHFYLFALIAAFLMLCLTLLIFWETQRRSVERNETLFQIQTENAQDAIEKRLNDYIQILKGAQSLLLVSDTVGRQEWKDYIMSLEINENYPGIQGIGYSIFVEEEELQAFESQIQESGYPEFRVWPREGQEVYTTIVYLEPFDLRNRRAFGYDMFSDSIRREAMIRARDSGHPALTGMVKLVQETTVAVQRGFLLYLPVYKRGTIPLTVEERQSSIVGFVYSPFRAKDLMNGILGQQYKELNIEIYDGEHLEENALLYQQSGIESFREDDSEQLYKQSSLQIGEHSWQLVFSAPDDFGYGSDFPWYILAGGLLTTILIFFILYSIANIRRSTYLNAEITNNATAAIFILDPKDRCTFMNPAAEILTGYTFDEMQESTLHQMVHHNHIDGSHFEDDECPIIQSLNRKRALINYQDIFYRKNGQIIDVSINARPIYENGYLTKHLLEVRDITQEKNGEEALKEKNQNLQTLNNIGKNLSSELGMKKLLQIVTDSCTELTGARFGAFFYRQKEEEEGRYKLFALSGADPKDFADFPMARNTNILSPTFQGKKIIRSDDISLDPGYGKSNPYNGMPKDHLPVKSYLAVPVISGAGQVFGGLFFGHPKAGVFDQHAEDMAKSIASQAAIAIDNSRLFEAISNKNKELVFINNELDNFVYTASHDLKAPVLNIEGLLYALDKALKENQTARVPQIFDLMRVSVLKFKETIQALTEVARTNKNLDEEKEIINLPDLLEEVRLSIGDMLEESEAQFTFELSCEQVYFSKTHLRSVLLNLISNAVKYRSSARKPQIFIGCRSTREGIELKVADNGLGIPQNQAAKIFMMFKRYHTHVEGTGVGLYLVKRIIENSGGSIAVDSKLDEGTIFILSIPQ